MMVVFRLGKMKLESVGAGGYIEYENRTSKGRVYLGPDDYARWVVGLRKMRDDYGGYTLQD